MEKRQALFLDRDGTLVHPGRYPSRPEDLHLYDGIGPELRVLQKAGFRLVIITNQAGIARGYFTEADLQRMHAYLTSELARLGVHLDGIYYCPHHIEGVIPEFAIRCNCRKPGWPIASDCIPDPAWAPGSCRIPAGSCRRSK